MGKIVFKETQKFRQWWLWLPLLGITFFIIYKLIKPFIGLFRNSSEVSVSIIMPWGYWISILVLLFVLFLFFFMTLKTTITKVEIKINYRPFFTKRFAWADVSKAEVVEHGFVGFGPSGTVYNVNGNKGLAITLKNGIRYLIGTQKPKELENSLKSNSLIL